MAEARVEDSGSGLAPASEGWLVEGEQQRLRAWDFVHCAPQTEHIFVGAGDGPYVILMAGARSEDDAGTTRCQSSRRATARAVKEETSDPDQAYAGFEWSQRERPSYWDRLPWA